MKRVVITTVFAACLATPALAQSQLERQLDVEADRYTNHQLAVLKGKAQESGAQSRVHFADTGDMVVSRTVAVNPRAAAIAADLSAAGKGGAHMTDGARAGGVVFPASASEAPTTTHHNGSNS